MSTTSRIRPTATLLLLCISCSASAEPAGALDPAFDDDGRQTVPFNVAGDDDSGLANDDDFSSMVTAPGGRIYVTAVARRNISNSAIGIARLRHDGSLDTAFGDGGTVVHDIVAGENVVLGSTSQPDGKLLVAGWQSAAVTSPTTAMLCRFLSDGERDAGFGSTATPGCQMFPSDFGGFFRSVFVQEDGRIVAFGSRLQIGAMIVRFNADGTYDNSFGANGVVSLGGPHGFSSFTALSQMPDGDLLAVGYTWLDDATKHDVLLFRVDSDDGSPQADFGAGGIKVVPLDLGTVPARRRDIATGSHAFDDGSLLVTGVAQTDDSPSDAEKSYRPFAMKFLSDGTLDPAFGGGIRIYGPCPTFLFECNVENRGLAVFEDGRFVIAGKYQYVDTSRGDFFAMRLLPDGELDTSFGPNNFGQEATALVDFGLVEPEFSLDDGEGVSLDGERVLVVGTVKVPPAGNNPGRTTDVGVARLDHGLEQIFFDVTPEVSGNGTVFPGEQLSISHSDHVDFQLTPAPGYRIANVAGCGDGGLYGTVYTTGAVTADCTVTVIFEPKPDAMFSDGFEQEEG